MSKRAVILAGGKGTRLKPYTISLPKPLVPIGNQPILEIIIKQLSAQGFTHITLAVNHFADIVKAFFGYGSKWNVKIDYTLEDKPLSTMGPLKLISDLPENFLIMNGDILTDLNFSDFFDLHTKSENLFTISSFEREEEIDFGVLEINNEKRLSGFQEKPFMKYTVSMGVYAAHKKILDFIPFDEAWGFDDLMYSLIKGNNLPVVKSHKGFWLDIGRPDDYEKASSNLDNLDI
jgi:NDP-sugar pyrophosphorylase family protein